MPFFRKTHSKMVAYMTSTIESIGQLQRTSSLRKCSKQQRISIIPLTREKVRVGQRGWKRRESRGTTDALTATRTSPVRDPSEQGRSRQYI
jgi:hypothetical protein